MKTIGLTSVLVFLFSFFVKIHNGFGHTDGKTVFFQLKSAVPERNNEIFCPSESVFASKYGYFEFEKTPASIKGTIAYAACPYSELDSGATYLGLQTRVIDIKMAGKNFGIGTRICYSISNEGVVYGIWDNFHFNGCRSTSMDSAIKRVKTITSSPVTEYNVKQLMPKLVPLFSNAPSDHQSAETLVEAINHALKAVELFSDGDPIMLQIRNQLFYYLTEYTAKVKLTKGQKVQVSSDDIFVESIIFPDDTRDYSYNFESLQIPNEALEMAKKSNLNSMPRLQIRGYSDALFSHWNTTKEWDNTTEVNGTELEFYGTWRIYEVEFGNVTIKNLSTPISYTIPVNESEFFQWICTFWNPEDGVWSTSGMKTIHYKNSISCESNHLTAFSILIDPKPESIDENDKEVYYFPSLRLNNHILSIISSVGSALSITGLTLTVLTYSLFRTLRRERSNRILLNLSLSLLLLHLSSLFSNKNYWNGFCAVPATMLHYFLLTSLSWMLVDGFFMYRILISVFVQPESKFLLKRILFAWGTPLAFVSLTGFIDLEMYIVGRDGLCIIAGHLNLPVYYGTYLLPAIFIILINTFVFYKIIHLLYKQNSRKRTEFTLRKRLGMKPGILSPIQIKGAVSLFVLLGIGWISGFLAIGPLQTPFTYIHTIMNAGQGLVIFVLRVVLDTKVIQTIRRTILLENETSFCTGTTGTRNSVTSNQTTDEQHHRSKTVNKKQEFSKNSVSSTSIYESSGINTVSNQDYQFVDKLAKNPNIIEQKINSPYSDENDKNGKY